MLSSIGINMIKESLGKENNYNDSIDVSTMIVLSIATSIDAFAVGLTYAFLGSEILIPSLIIGVVAFLFGICGVFIGRKIGNYFGNKFQIVGGIILIIIGVKILLGF